MDTSDMLRTVQRDVALIAAQLEIAKHFAGNDDAKAAWYHMDLAEARIQSLSGYIGLKQEWDANVIADARRVAQETILPRPRR